MEAEDHYRRCTETERRHNGAESFLAVAVKLHTLPADSCEENRSLWLTDIFWASMYAADRTSLKGLAMLIEVSEMAV